MKYGYFDDKNKEYVISTPYTPLAWINFLGSQSFFSLISNTCGGYSFYKDAKLRRLTRFRYNSVPDDSGGRCYYIKDGDSVFSPAFLPCKTPLKSYKCRHGLGYTIFESECNSLQTSLTCFVPLEENCEINHLTIKNTSACKKSIQLYASVEWCLWNAVDDSSNFQRNYSIGEVEIEDNAIYHKSEYKERRNHYAFFAANHNHSGFDTDRAEFLGKFNSWDTPKAVMDGTSYNSVASGWSPIGCHRFDVEIPAGGEYEIVFILGYIENEQENKFEREGIINKQKAHALIKKYSTTAFVRAAKDELEQYWDKLLGKINVDTQLAEFDRMVNIWNQYQCMVTFNMSRSASYFESGMGRGMGFRDSCQDLLGSVLLLPHSRTRERILDIAAIQFEDGSTYHQYQPLTKTGNADAGQGFNDDPLWLIAATAAYIKETGDSSILQELVVFNNTQGTQKPLFEHLRRSVNYTLNNLGPHSLPLIGRADWNDCLNLNCFSQTPGESFQTCSNYESGKAESVFIGGMFVLYATEYAKLCQLYGDASEAAAVLDEVKKMQEAVIKSGWDGEWFLRAYDAFGEKVGSSSCEEGKIYIEPQGFCSMAGIGGEEFAKKALNSVKKHLYNDFGAEILSPCYTRYHEELGEITSYPCGYKENGAVFCHNNPWLIGAFAKIGDGESAFDLYTRFCPAFIEDKSEIHRTEPYVYSQMIAGRAAKRYGEAKNSWLTGTASWTFVAATQFILGIYPDYEGLKIEPCLPSKLKDIRVKRVFRGVLYDIHIVNKHGKKPTIFVDGKPILGNVIRCDSVKDKHVKVEVEM